jgi:hypothetical protein
MQLKSTSLRGKLMIGCALLVACVLAAPAAMAHDRYQGRGDRDSNLLGALVVGAVIGGVLVSASNHHRDYYGSGYYYPTTSYAPGGYYGGYPAYGYGGSYNSYPAYGYGGGVNVGVVYSNRGGYYGGSRGYYHRHGYDGYHGNNGYRGERRGNWNNGWNRRGNDHHSSGGYYHHRGD